jgi:hypothetical protein
VRPLLLLLLLSGCASGDPCTWLITNDTGEPVIELVTAGPSGQWSDDVLAGEPLAYGDQVAIDIDAGRPQSVLATGFSGDRYIVVRAVECTDGEQLFTEVGIGDREL